VASVVVDSSAVIALLRDEPGAEIVASHLDDAAISAVNLQEVAKKLLEAGFEDNGVRETLDALNLEIHAHDAEDAYLAASLLSATRRYGRGLGDRSCIALALKLDVPAITTDRSWSELELPGLRLIMAR
jgi:ribonuclease VapC